MGTGHDGEEFHEQAKLSIDGLAPQMGGGCETSSDPIGPLRMDLVPPIRQGMRNGGHGIRGWSHRDPYPKSAPHPAHGPLKEVERNHMATVMTTTFELAGADGGPLRGEVRTAEGGENRPAVVICHGFKGFKDWGFFPKLADRLAHAGFSAISFNFTGSGIGPDGENFSEPERFGHATFSKDVEDIGLVCRRLSNGQLRSDLAQPTKVGLFGHSRGGGMSVIYTSGADDISAIVTWSAIGSLERWPEDTVSQWRRDGKLDVPNARTGDILPVYTDLLDDIEAHKHGKLDLLAAAGRINVPWMILHGDADETVAVSEAKSLKEAASQDRTLLHIVPGASHTMGSRHPWAGLTPELDFAMGETVGWFAKHLF